MCKVGLYIKEQIDRNNKLIEQFLTPNQFVLNNTISQLLGENAKLQKQCLHEFNEGYCIYCYKSEEDK
jgi:hypothetical protein